MRAPKAGRRPARPSASEFGIKDQFRRLPSPGARGATPHQSSATHSGHSRPQMDDSIPRMPDLRTQMNHSHPRSGHLWCRFDEMFPRSHHTGFCFDETTAHSHHSPSRFDDTPPRMPDSLGNNVRVAAKNTHLNSPPMLATGQNYRLPAVFGGMS